MAPRPQAAARTPHEGREVARSTGWRRRQVSARALPALANQARAPTACWMLDPPALVPHLVFAGFDKDAKRAEKGKYFIHLFLQTFQLAL